MTRGAEHCTCTLCQGGYDKWTYVFARIVDGPLTGATVCPQCLAAHDRGEIDDRLHDMLHTYLTYVKEYQALADKIRQSIGSGFTAPTFEEWQQAERLADADYVTANS